LGLNVSAQRRFGNGDAAVEERSHRPQGRRKREKDSEAVMSCRCGAASRNAAVAPIMATSAADARIAAARLAGGS
jgi:hypothetical protein